MKTNKSTTVDAMIARSAALKTAAKKGLKVQKNWLTPGWSVTLPNGTVFCAKDDADLVRFVKNY